MVTHDQEEAMTMASRMAVMSEGRFLQVGSPADIYETPTTRFVADFIGNVNLMEGTIAVGEGGHLEIRGADAVHRVGQTVTGSSGQRVTVALRPEKIHMSIDKPEDEHNQVQGVVKALSYFGDHTIYHLELPSGGRLKVNVENETRQREGARAHGDTVWAHWLPASQVVLTQ
jgi:putrescine transport system ATP-binding protein